MDTYETFAEENAELLKSLPPPRIAVKYYTEDLFLYDEMALGGQRRRPRIDNLYDGMWYQSGRCLGLSKLNHLSLQDDCGGRGDAHEDDGRLPGPGGAAALAQRGGCDRGVGGSGAAD